MATILQNKVYNQTHDQRNIHNKNFEIEKKYIFFPLVE